MAGMKWQDRKSGTDGGARPPVETPASGTYCGTGGAECSSAPVKVTTGAVDSHFEIFLNGQMLVSPHSKSRLALPCRDLAREVGKEWQEAGPRPLSGIIFAARDRLEADRPYGQKRILAYFAQDALCHRPAAPPTLVAFQAGRADPLLDWAERIFGLRPGVSHVLAPLAQDPALLEAAFRKLDDYCALQLAAGCQIAEILASGICAMAAMAGAFDGPTLFAAGDSEAEWNRRKWGMDDEAARSAAATRRLFDAAIAILAACHRTPRIQAPTGARPGQGRPRGGVWPTAKLPRAQ